MYMNKHIFYRACLRQILMIEYPYRNATFPFFEDIELCLEITLSWYVNHLISMYLSVSHLCDMFENSFFIQIHKLFAIL
jgi:hypothetical protein